MEPSINSTADTRPGDYQKYQSPTTESYVLPVMMLALLGSVIAVWIACMMYIWRVKRRERERMSGEKRPEDEERGLTLSLEPPVGSLDAVVKVAWAKQRLEHSLGLDRSGGRRACPTCGVLDLVAMQQCNRLPGFLPSRSRSLGVRA